MISNFSDAEYLMKRPPHPRERFFEQAVFDQDLSQGLLELARLSPELLDLVRGRLTRRVAGEPFLARLQELLRPTVVPVLIDPFLAAQLSNAVLATMSQQPSLTQSAHSVRQVLTAYSQTNLIFRP